MYIRVNTNKVYTHKRMKNYGWWRNGCNKIYLGREVRNNKKCVYANV